MSCQNRFFINQQGLCEHYVFPPNIQTIIGSILTILIAGFSSLAGVGGGTPHLVVIMILFNYSPKDSTIIVFSSILGTTLGNVLSQMKKKINDQPIIQYKYAFISIPIMFMGSFIGVFANKLLPSAYICLFIMYIAASSIKGIYDKFKISYQKQTQQNNLQDPLSSNKYIQTQYNPFHCQKNVYIFKNLLILILVYMVIACLKGTQKLDSVINLKRCSQTYWALYFFAFFIMGLFSYLNLQILKKWQKKPLGLDQKNPQQNIVQTNINIVIKKSLSAGIFSGFGLGGGLFLVPMYKSLGCNSIQATASCAFSIFATACLNCIQGMLLGVIKFDDFINFFILTACGSYFMSNYLSRYLQKINRISIAQFVLLTLVGLALINLPYSLYKKYERSNYNPDIIFGFGKVC